MDGNSSYPFVLVRQFRVHLTLTPITLLLEENSYVT